MKYYKVVRKRDKELLSAVVFNNFCINYELNNWVDKKPNTGGIFVFNSLEKAISFANSILWAEVYECKVKNPRPLIKRAYLESWHIESFWSVFFQQKKSKKKIDWSFTHNSTPSGTYIVNSVKLVKKVC